MAYAPQTSTCHAGKISKESGFYMKLTKTHAIIFITTLLLGGFIFSSVLRPVSAQNAQATSTPALPPPVPTTSSVTKDEFEALKSKVNSLEDKVQPFTNWMNLLGLLGLTSPLVLAKIAYEYHKKALRNAFYRADPRNFPVYVPKMNFETEKKNLEKLGLKKLRTYGFLDEIDDKGVIVFHILGENFDKDEKAKKRLGEAIEELKAFMENNRDKPFAYVVYIKGQPPELRDLLQTGNIASANMPVTIAGHIYTLAHGLMD